LESLDSSILKPFAHKRDEEDQDQELKNSRKKRTFSTKKQTLDHPKTLNIALLQDGTIYGVLMEFSEGEKGSALVPIPRVGIRFLPQTVAGRKSRLSVRPHAADRRLPT